MMSQWKTWFTSPEDRPGGADTAQLLRASVLVSLGISAVAASGALLVRSPGWERLLRDAVFVLGVSLGLWLLLRRGHVRFVAYGMVLGYGAIATYGGFTGIGVRGTAYSLYTLIVMIAALFIHWRAGYIVAAVASLIGLAMLWANRAGWLPNADRPLAEMAVWLNASAYFFVTAVLLNIALRQVDRALERARRDLAERRRAEGEVRRLNAELEQRIAERTAQLAASEERYRLISTVSSDYMFSTRLDAEGELALNWVAGAFEAITGYSFEAYVARGGWLAALHPDDAEQDARDMAALRANQRVVTEVRAITKRGETRWVRVYAHPVWDPAAQQLTGIYGAVQDITERKQADAERETLIKELEAKNAELERFSYTVSHDLKSPLITIRGFLGYLEKDAVSGSVEQLRADLARIADATGRMQRLLDELLELSRIGRKMNPPEDAPFEAIVREALALVEGRLTRRGVQVHVAPSLPVVHGDQARLVEVVQNLVDNAAKFMGAQPAPRIEIGVRAADGDAPPVFYVCDNGIGIDLKYRERVFGLFDKLDAQSEGTGVGLALVKRIVEVHGGRIWVESDGPGAGSTFCFTLPNK